MQAENSGPASVHLLARAFTAGRYSNYNAFEVWVLENFLPALKNAK